MGEIMNELREIRNLKLAIGLDRERLQSLRATIGTASSRIRETGSRGSAEHDAMSGQVARLIDLQDAVAARIAACEGRIAHIGQAVDTLPGALRIVMRLRYFEGYGWQQVARAMHYTTRRCLQFHNEAERMLEAVCMHMPTQGSAAHCPH